MGVNRFDGEGSSSKIFSIVITVGLNISFNGLALFS